MQRCGIQGQMPHGAVFAPRDCQLAPLPKTRSGMPEQSSVSETPKITGPVRAHILVSHTLQQTRPRDRNEGHPLHAAEQRICPARLSGSITTGRSTMAFEDIKVHVRLKLFALWSSLMFFYIYADYIQLWQPGNLQGMLEGRRTFAGSPQGVLLGMSCVMIVPCLMPFLSVVLPVRFSRLLNIL